MNIAGPSLRRVLLMRLLAPLVLVTLLASLVAYAGARHFSSAVLDQWLYDAAISIANRVHWQLQQPGAATRTPAAPSLDEDLVDRVLYQVTADDGRTLAGNAALGAPPKRPGTPNARHLYFDVVNGAAVRVVAVRVSRGGRDMLVLAAESVQRRTTLARQLSWLALGLSIMLAAVASGVIWYGIGRGITATEKAMRNAWHDGSTAPLVPLAVTPDMPTEVLPLVAQINRLIEELVASHRVNERFIANAAHQLRTPVATLRVQLEAASREADPLRRAAHIDDAVRVVAHMSRALHQLLTLARADERAGHPLGHAWVDIDRIARDEVEARLDDAVALGVDLGYEGPGEPVIVDGTAELVREALANLLDNALRYGGAGGIVTVGVDAAPSPQLYVEDRGPGIPEDERARVTDRFYRLPGTSGEGCGLGLAIVDEIARLCDAKLRLDAGATGAGLRATLVFPAPRARSPRGARERSNGDGRRSDAAAPASRSREPAPSQDRVTDR